MVTPEAGRGRLRASHADREQVVDVLKAAFVQGRLAQDELDARVGQALAARTYADLAALTADLPAQPSPTAPAPAPAPAPAAAPAPALAQPHWRAVKVGGVAIGSAVVVTSGTVAALGQPVTAVVLAMATVLLTACATAFVAALIAVVLKLESRQQHRSRGQLPPGPASGASGPSAPRPPAADPARPRTRHPPGSLALGSAS